jgi:hypothetical protein
MLQHRRNLSRGDFLSGLDTIVLNQIGRVLTKRDMPPIMQKEDAQEGFRTPFPAHPLLGHLAIYSVNLVTLRASIDVEEFLFEESSIPSHEDGSRPWDQLTHLWRSWFGKGELIERYGGELINRVMDRIDFRIIEGRLHVFIALLEIANRLGVQIVQRLQPELLREVMRRVSLYQMRPSRGPSLSAQCTSSAFAQRSSASP